MPDKWVKLLATFFYIGKAPVAPGTMASLAGGVLAFIFFKHPLLYLTLLVVIILVGFKVCGRMEEILKQKDPSCVVIDEVAGMMIALWMLPFEPSVLITSFFLFRAFDMFKIYPVNKLERLEGSAGIIADDLMAGLYTNLTMQTAMRLVGMM